MPQPTMVRIEGVDGAYSFIRLDNIAQIFCGNGPLMLETTNGRNVYLKASKKGYKDAIHAIEQYFGIKIKD